MTFPILIEVEDSALGSVLKMLNGYPGIAKLHLDLDGVNGPRGARRGLPQGPRKQRQDGEPSTTEVVIAALMNGPLRNRDISEALGRQGFSRTSTPSTITALKNRGIVHSLGGGLWDLTDEAKTRIAPRAALPAPGAQTSSAGHDKTAHELVIEKMKNLGGSAQRLDLAQHLSANNLSAASISRVINDLKKRGVVEEDGERGAYRLVEQKKSAPPAAKKTAAKPEPVEGAERSSKKPAILKFLKRRKGPVSSGDIATAIGATSGAVHGALFRLQQTGDIEKVSPGMFQLTTKKNAAEEPSTTQE